MNSRLQASADFDSHPFKWMSNLMHSGVAENMSRVDHLSPSSVPQLQTSGGVRHGFGLLYGAAGLPIGSSLSFRLGQPSSSSDSKGSSVTACTAATSTMLMGEEYSTDLGLDLDLNLGIEKYPTRKNPSFLSEKDLELSLCTGSLESDITEISSSPPVVQVRKELAPPLLTPPMPSFPRNLSSPFGFLANKSTVSCTSGITKKLRSSSSSNTRKCQVEGCNKGARGASGRCISHGGGRRCQRPGCSKGAEGRTPYCKAHGGGRRCEHLGCTKSAEGRTYFCIAHGGGRRCDREGCTKAARGKSGRCIRHGGGKRCQMEGCSRSAEGLSGLCISHGGGRRCQFPGGCSKGAQGSTDFCKAHGGGKRCTYPGCGKGAEGSTLFCKGHGGGKRCLFEGGGVCTKSVHGGTNFCVAHGGGKRCAMPECTRSARGRTAFCVRHGGGKRCSAPDCGKSAQGSTEFCKAHGGGTRCSWGLLDNQCGTACIALTRGTTGLCALHNGMMQDKKVHGGAAAAAGSGMSGLEVDQPGNTNESGLTADDVSMDMRTDASDVMMGFGLPSNTFPVVSSVAAADPEGRVHGGSLMTILTGRSTRGEESVVVPPGWI
ncbi:hypothetical protein SAY86_001463 [Trapa natans]|uniref:WRKY19-like zinc finger domain-containing protein n=1 Tax=Trapa natans TaxID=22666 RepID=A0AAN7MW23_TRANT|nr:hypothetical protein SAY86_001463 [Trapa natans]